VALQAEGIARPANLHLQQKCSRCPRQGPHQGAGAGAEREPQRRHGLTLSGRRRLRLRLGRWSDDRGLSGPLALSRSERIDGDAHGEREGRDELRTERVIPADAALTPGPLAGSSRSPHARSVPGEPYAGEPPVRFGGRGGSRDTPLPPINYPPRQRKGITGTSRRTTGPRIHG
jgi:hypothetical protein